MIPANVSTTVNANPSVNAGIMGAGMAFAEPTSAELAEFDQLLGGFNQWPEMMALSTPALTLANQSQGLPARDAEVQVTPEGLLSTLEQSAIMALPAVAIASEVSLADMNQQAVMVGLGSNTESNATQTSAQTTSVSSSMNSTATELLQPNVAVPTQANPSVSSELVTEFFSVADVTQAQAQPSRPIASVMAVPEKMLETELLPTTPLVSVASSLATQPIKLAMEKQSLLSTPSQNASAVPVAANSALVESELSVSPAVLQANNLITKTDQANLASGVTLVNSISITAIQPKVVTENQPTATVNQVLVTANQATAELTKTLELTAAVSPLLGDNKAVIFANTPTISSASTGMVQLPVITNEATSPLNTGSSVAVMAVSMANSSEGAASQGQHQETSASDRFMQALSDAESVDDLSSDAHEFSLVSASPLSAIASSPILAAPLSLRHPQWTQDVAQRVQVMVNQSMNELEVRLDPLDLGPMKIKLALDEQQKAHVTLSAQHTLTRDMLENALPRLKELLAQEGIELASVNVNAGDHGGTNAQENPHQESLVASEFIEDAANLQADQNLMRSTDNLVDHYV